MITCKNRCVIKQRNGNSMKESIGNIKNDPPPKKRKKNPADTLIWAFSPQNWEKINSCCFSPGTQPMGFGYGRPG